MIKLVVSLLIIGGLSSCQSKSGTTSRSWDCCKASCSWDGKVQAGAPIKSCSKDGHSQIDKNEKSGCDGGKSYMCLDQTPWAVNDQLSYGFASAKIKEKTEKDLCGQCYKLKFTSQAVSGKEMIVQVTNTRNNLSDDHFDLLIPGGGTGKVNGCKSQFNNLPDSVWGKQNGGISEKHKCDTLPDDMRHPCQWRFDWFKNADNPNVDFEPIDCPHELTDKTGSKQGGDHGHDGQWAKGQTTRYWDCCKPSCAWNGKGDVSAPVKSCQIDGHTKIDMNAQNGCGGGPSYMCADQQPWVFNNSFAYGFAAAAISGKDEKQWCCACYHLKFTDGLAKGKEMIVQVTNTGGDLHADKNHFDLQIPGGGVGIFNGCEKQYKAPKNGWGDQYGGVHSKAECGQLPNDLKKGCQWRFDWFNGADNPNMQFKRVKCPKEILAKTGCKRDDD